MLGVQITKDGGPTKNPKINKSWEGGRGGLLFGTGEYFFFLYQSPSLFLCTVFNSNSSNTGEVLSINPSMNVFVFWDFYVHHKDWLTYSGKTDRPGELCYNFSVSNSISQMVNFCTWIPGDEFQITVSFFLFFFFFFLI